MRRSMIVFLFGTIAIAALAPAQSGHADIATRGTPGAAGAGTGDGAVVIGGTVGGGSRPNPDISSSGVSLPFPDWQCSIHLVSTDPTAEFASGPIPNLDTLAIGTRVEQFCSGSGPDGSIREGNRFFWAGLAPPSPQQLANLAVARLVLPLPDARMWPKPSRQITGFRTWLHVANWTEQQQSASAGGVTVTAHAVPETARWTFPTDSLTCQDGGTVWTPGYSSNSYTPACSWVPYTASFTRRLTSEPASVAVRWRVWWTSSLGHDQPLGNVTRTTDIAMTILEYQVTTGPR